MFDIKALREEFSRNHTEATGVIDAAAKDSRELTEEETAANEKRFSRMKTIKKLIDDHQKFAGLTIAAVVDGEDDEAADDQGTVTTPKDPAGRAEFDASEGRSRIIVGEPKFDRDAFSKALNRWAATGEMERKFATITTATASGALLPKQIGLPVVPMAINVFRDGLAAYGMQPVVTGTTAALTIPVMGQTGGGEVAENAAAETENTPTLSDSIVLNCKTYQSGSAYFSNLQLAATDFDLVTYIQSTLLESKEQGLEDAIVDAIVADAGVTQSVTASGNAASEMTYSDLVDLNRKLPKKWDRLKMMVLNAEAFAAAEKLVGSNGQPILVKDPQNQTLVRFNGTPVFRSDYVPVFANSAVVGLLVSLAGFRLRDTTQQQLARYTQVPAKPDQTGFNLFGYHGYGYAPTAVAKLVAAAA